MQSDQQYHPCGNMMTSFENQVGFDITANNAVGMTNFPLENKLSAERIELQPLENSPGNFSIFNQTVDRRQMMFHPVFPQRFTYPGFHVHAASMENNAERWNNNEEEKEISSPFTEDSDEINALLSLDNDQSFESEEEEVSTARTNGYDGSSSPDSSCNYSSKSKKVKFSSSQNADGGGGSSSSSSSCNNERKRKKMQKMVNVLRGMVPGGQQLSTTAVLDEAVKYLKSLRVEVEQNGVDDSKHPS